MITVGLTGGIACGKSTVAHILRAQGVPVLDLDHVSRTVVEPGSTGFAAIQALWPSVCAGGTLDRKALGAIVVADPEARKQLEAIVHPRVWEAAETWIAAQASTGAPAAVVEAALMVETGSFRRYDQLIVVSCSPETQRARLATREGYDESTANRWLAAQLPLIQKETVATIIIRNEGNETDLTEATLNAWKGLGLGVWDRPAATR